MKKFVCLAFCSLLTVLSCDIADRSEPFIEEDVSPEELAQILSRLPLGSDQMREVHDAVCCSSSNGYDEEYMMKDLFGAPGKGVGGHVSTRASNNYPVPMRKLIEEYLSELCATKASTFDTDRYISALTSSALQIYWPFSDLWDGSTLPVVTFDPMSDASVNKGYEILEGPAGERSVREISVDEQLARNRPVWVVNTNDDSSFTSLEMRRRQNPDWGMGGSVVVKGGRDDIRSLVLKDFKANRNYDSWFGGASEFFVKCGSLEGFTASTEAEMRLYSASVTDFMIVVKRNQIGETLPFNALLISDWTEQLENFAFLITEDDGGTRTSWDCEALVKVESKSYGVSLKIPYNDRDDIVWRGSLSSRYLDNNLQRVQHFGDVDLTFGVIDDY